MAEEEPKLASWRWAAGGFYAFISVAFTIYLIVLLIAQPLFPFQSENVDWGMSWLLLAVVDYYHMAACFCGIVIATESRLAAIIWCLLTCILGAPFACLYTAKQIGFASSLTLRENYEVVRSIYAVSKPEKPLQGFVGYIVAAIYLLAGSAFGARLVWTLTTYSLAEIGSADAEWAFEWFFTTVLDYYTIALCLIGIVLSTEDTCPGLAWVAGMVFITGPAGSAWMAQRIFRERPLALESA